MKKLTIVALVCAMSFMPHQAHAIEQNFIKERFDETKNALVKKMGAMFVLWGDSSLDSQKKRLEIYQWFEKNVFWMLHPKKWMRWIATGSMPVKYPDNRVTDEQYVKDYLIYKELLTGLPLTEDGKNAARIEAMELLTVYRQAKGIR